MASVLLIVLLVALPVQQAQAANKWFDCNGTAGGGGTSPIAGNVSGGSNWSTSDAGTDPGLWVAGDTAYFSAGTPAVTTAHLNSAITAAGIVVEDGFVTLDGASAITIGTGTVTVGSGTTLSTNSNARISCSAGAKYQVNGGTLQTTNGAANGSFISSVATISLNGGGTVDYSVANLLNIINPASIISGTGPLTKTGVGVIALAAPSTYSGATNVNGGELRVRTNNNVLPTGTDLIVNSPGIFNLNGLSQQVASLSGNGNVGTGSGTLTINGSASTTFNGALKNIANAGAGAVSSGNGKLTKNGSGTITFAGVNDIKGTVTLTAGGITVASGASLCGAICDVVVNGGTLNLNNAAQTIENLNGTGGTINLALGHTLTSAAVGNTAYSGVIAGQGALVIANAFTLALNGTNVYTGGTTVNAGVLEVGGSILGDVTVASAGGLKLDSATALASGATLNLAGSPVAGSINLNFTGFQGISALYFGATKAGGGTWGALGSLAEHENAAFSGAGWLSVVPEPASIVALAVGMVSLLGLRRRRA